MFNNYACVWFSIHHYPTGVFASVLEIASRHRDQFAHGGKTINV